MPVRLGPQRFLKVTTIRNCGSGTAAPPKRARSRMGSRVGERPGDALRKEGETFVATCADNEVYARFVLLATGLVDHCPPIEGQPANCPSAVIRFCPICDGYEAIDLRVGVLGDIEAGGKKALFLITYTKEICSS
jgi:thioredoxin reductase (NADPH)